MAHDASSRTSLSGDDGPAAKRARPLFVLNYVKRMPRRVQDAFNNKSPFIVGEYEDGLVALSRLELKLRELSGAILNKPLWFEKKNNPEIVSKWRQEALEQGISEEGFNFVIQELDYYDSLRFERTFI